MDYEKSYIMTDGVNYTPVILTDAERKIAEERHKLAILPIGVDILLTDNTDSYVRINPKMKSMLFMAGLTVSSGSNNTYADAEWDEAYASAVELYRSKRTYSIWEKKLLREHEYRLGTDTDDSVTVVQHTADAYQWCLVEQKRNVRDIELEPYQAFLIVKDGGSIMFRQRWSPNSPSSYAICKRNASTTNASALLSDDNVFYLPSVAKDTGLPIPLTQWQVTQTDKVWAIYFEANKYVSKEFSSKVLTDSSVHFPCWATEQEAQAIILHFSSLQA